MGNFDEDIKRITNEIMRDGTVDKIIKDKVTKGFEDAIDSAFRWGKLKDTIEKRIEEVMIPYIEKYDMSDYIIKLDTILSDIVNCTALQDNAKILENFKSLMLEPEEKEVTLTKIFEEYKKHVAEKMDTIGREVIYDDEPYYKPMEVTAKIIEDKERSWSSFQHAVLELAAEEEDQQDRLNFSLRLSRWKGDRHKGYDISYDVAQSVRGLRNLSDFEIYILRLARVGVKFLDDVKEDYDSVVADNEPELTYE